MVCVRPSWGDTATDWGSEQLKRKTIAYAKAAGWSVTDLYADDAVKTKIIEALKKANFGSLLGHGNNSVFTGQRQEIVFQVNDAETLAFCQGAGDIVLNFLSCLMGKGLAPWMTQNGLRAAKAYTEEFVFANDPGNFPNSVADPFFLAYCEFDKVFMQTQSEDQAYQAELRKWEEVIDASDAATKPYKIQDYDAAELFKKGQEPPPQPPPTCPVSRAIQAIFGRKALQALRGVRKAIFGTEPGYP
jgi:hypothetical protein